MSFVLLLLRIPYHIVFLCHKIKNASIRLLCTKLNAHHSTQYIQLEKKTILSMSWESWGWHSSTVHWECTGPRTKKKVEWDTTTRTHGTRSGEEIPGKLKKDVLFNQQRNTLLGDLTRTLFTATSTTTSTTTMIVGCCCYFWFITDYGESTTTGTLRHATDDMVHGTIVYSFFFHFILF